MKVCTHTHTHTVVELTKHSFHTADRHCKTHFNAYVQYTNAPLRTLLVKRFGVRGTLPAEHFRVLPSFLSMETA